MASDTGNKKTLGISIVYGTAGSSSPATVLGGTAGKIDSLDEAPDLNFDEYDDSAIDQTSLVKDYQLTLMDGGKISGKIKMTEANYAAGLALMDGSKRSFGLQFLKAGAEASTGALIYMDGKLKRWQLIPGGGTNGKVLVGFEVRIVGIPAITAGA